jgi:8-oxo-dGTP pyrophosphatase MutT (NUDIX family)
MGPVDVLRRLREGLGGPLPGHAEFMALSGYPRPDLAAVRLLDPPPKPSAVLALLFPRGGELRTLLMRRPVYRGVHSGQVSFPGGKQEPGDADLLQTALREFREETGADTGSHEVIGALTPVYIPPSNYLVTPYVAYTEALAGLSPDPREVAAIIEAPVSALLREDVVRRGRVPLPDGRSTREVPYFALCGEVVWGATALMLAELRELLRR